MLISLDIENFGLIDRESIVFEPGLNVLTGETGAGKSIIVDAITVVLGGRASAGWIKSGRERARLTAVADAGEPPGLADWLAERGVGDSGDGTLVLSRELAANGRHICRLNGQAVTLGVYREAGGRLADLHGQHEQQSLFLPDRQRDLLDRSGGAPLLEKRAAAAALYASWRRARQSLDELLAGARDRARRLDMLAYQVHEIDQARPAEGEEEELTAERNRLANAEKIAALAAECYACLHGGEPEGQPALDALNRAAHALNGLCRLDGSVKPLLETVESSLYQLEDAARELAAYRETVEYNPERLQIIEDRLSSLRQLQRKYGDTVAEVLRYREQAAAEMEMLSGSEQNTAALEKEVQVLAERWHEAAAGLTAARRQAAGQLEKEITAELAELEMGRVEFKVQFEDLSGPAAAGAERVEFLISPNPGEPLRPLARIASGGELSRVMLAARAILAAVDEVPTLVFDEVDAGIGGRALQAVAEKLAAIARRRQVLCITHAAQIASFAAAHFYICKEVRGGQTRTRVEKLDPAGRLEELARMLGGRDVDGLVKEHARYMLQQAQGR
ncbi:DNA repair protein RecN [Desulfotomaculum copahuensis]|uniref:DNA repair protein RecN n=1 Tax=Desulfotomaculum copahuensis TaxID=1838280 RepID=A0A1B7LIY8_9FIRM|nr:DNA repair protein RecN [Desulfotomaculum copahuensis]OAT86513.1 DNA repair protein RecN [Desulfotomaculum copahuensis]